MINYLKRSKNSTVPISTYFKIENSNNHYKSFENPSNIRENSQKKIKKSDFKSVRSTNSNSYILQNKYKASNSVISDANLEKNFNKSEIYNMNLEKNKVISQIYENNSYKNDTNIKISDLHKYTLSNDIRNSTIPDSEASFIDNGKVNILETTSDIRKNSVFESSLSSESGYKMENSTKNTSKNIDFNDFYKFISEELKKEMRN